MFQPGFRAAPITLKSSWIMLCCTAHNYAQEYTDYAFQMHAQVTEAAAEVWSWGGRYLLRTRITHAQFAQFATAQ